MKKTLLGGVGRGNDGVGGEIKMRWLVCLSHDERSGERWVWSVMMILVGTGGWIR